MVLSLSDDEVPSWRLDGEPLPPDTFPRVYLDGYLLSNCTYADDRRGIVEVAYNTDPWDSAPLPRRSILQSRREQRLGRVIIKLGR